MTQYPVAILIPVYNAFEDACECLRSVLEHTESDVPILVIDDASVQGDFQSYLVGQGVVSEQISVQRNLENLGFLKTVNIGFAQLEESDVLLLNSDTVVTSNWLIKLREAAYSREGIGTVTPFTNNGVVASIPLPFEDNSLPEGYTLAQFADLVESVSERVRPEIPSCVGFCTYLKREMLDTCGGFDEVAFENGYGEENDLSRRMRRYGYTDVLDDATFIYHKGCASFGAEKHALVEAHTRVLQKRYPDYFEDVRRFRAHNPLREIHARIEKVLFENWEKEHPRRILHILHNGPFKAYHFAPGGTELQVARLIEDEDEFAHYSLVFVDNTLCLTAHLPGWKKEFLLPLEKMSFADLLRRDLFEVVHVHHYTPLSLPDFAEALKAHGNYFISLHDFTVGCPRNYLLTPALKLCSTMECSTACGYGASFIKDYRAEAVEILEGAAKRFVFSYSSKEYLQKIFGQDLSFDVLQHGTIPLPQIFTEQDLKEGVPHTLRIVVPGKIARHKGSEILKALLRHRSVPGSSVALEWHIVGDDHSAADGQSVYSHGAYTYEDLPERIQSIRPHLALFLSLAPETYGMTVDEQLALGVPVLVPPQGAPAERVAEHGGGLILREVSEKAVLDILQKITGDPASFREVSLRAIRHRVKSSDEEVREIKGEYKLAAKAGDISDIYQLLSTRCVSHIKEKNPLRILVGKTLGTCVVLTERLGIRSSVESVFQRVLPGPIKHRLKKARVSTL